MDKTQLWQQHFPALATSDDTQVQTLIRSSKLAQLPADTCVFSSGQACEHYLLVASGRVKVVLYAESGREVVLYRVLPGETCVLTTACLLGQTHYIAEGITESEVSALMVHHEDFQAALHTSPAFRNFVFADMGKRFADVIARMERIKFGPVESRLAAALISTWDTHKPHIQVTHQTLANEVGTAREVVSRYLKRFEAEGLIRLKRGHIELLDLPGLRKLAATR